MDKRKKSKFQCWINRIKNKMQYLRKRFAVPFICVLLCFSLISVTLFSTKQQAYATGVEEMLYYTYWDLISGLFAETGYEFSSPDSYYAKPDRASGKDVWDNFCTWVENKAKVLSLPVEVVNDTIFKELENLPNIVNAAGVSMSEALAQLLGTVLPTAVDDTVESLSISTEKEYLSLLASVCGVSVSRIPAYGFVKNGYVQVFYIPGESANPSWYICMTSKVVVGSDSNFNFVYSDGTTERGVAGMIFNHATFSYNSTWYNSKAVSIVKNGVITADGVALSDFARVKVKEKTEDRDGVYIPGVGWKTKWDVWNDVLDGQGATDKEKEEWWLRYHVDELLKDVPDSNHVDPDDEKRRKENNKKDRLPVFIPIVLPHKKDDKEDTEESTEESTEKDTEGVVVPIPTPDPTEDTSEDSTQDSTQDQDYEDVIDSAGKGGNWKRLFPFCIPWDIMTLIKSMNATKKAPHFKFEHTFKNINYTFKIDVDMSDYWKYIKIFRWGMAIFFIIGLFFLTVKFTTFVHRGS